MRWTIKTTKKEMNKAINDFAKLMKDKMPGYEMLGCSVTALSNDSDDSDDSDDSVGFVCDDERFICNTSIIVCKNGRKGYFCAMVDGLQERVTPTTEYVSIDFFSTNTYKNRLQ